MDCDRAEQDMRLAVSPRNEFEEFIDAYFDECRKHFDGIDAIAAKWTFEDLAPGLSDFDTRFICRNGMTVDDWCEMSTVVGRVHLEMCRDHPSWYKILEHTPGINLTWDELTDENAYYPQYSQWTIHRCISGAQRDAIVKLSRHSWNEWDEYFHLKMFVSRFGAYDRTIDPPVNMAANEHKYALHSRFMHYFTPAVQAAVSVILHRSICGKLEALRLAAELFPEIAILRQTLEAIPANYDLPELCEESSLCRVEDELYRALIDIGRYTGECLTIIPEDIRRKPEEWKECLRSLHPPDSFLSVECVKFARLFKGRLHFYANAPEDFDISIYMPHQLRYIGNYFYRMPFLSYARKKFGRNFDSAEDAVDALVGDVVDKNEAEAVKRLGSLALGDLGDDSGRRAGLEVAGLYDTLLRSISRMY